MNMRALAVLIGVTGCAPAHTPLEEGVAFVRGAPVSLELIPTDELLQQLEGWSDADVDAWISSLEPVSLWSSDPLVFDVEAGESWSNEAEGVALGEGSASVDFEDPWTGSGAMSVSVFEPDRLDLKAFDPYAGGGDGWAPVDAVQVVVGGLVQLEAQPWYGELALSGAHVLEVEHGPGLTTEVSAVEGRDALTLRASEPGEHVIALYVAGEPLGELLVTAVPPGAAASMRLVQVGEELQEPGEAGEERWSRRALRVEDADGAPILGFEPEWTVGGEPAGSGDTLRYRFDGEGALAAEARLGELTVQVTLPAASAEVSTTRAGGALRLPTGLMGLGLGLLAWLAGRVGE